MRRLQLRAQRRSFAGFPLNRPRSDLRRWAAPWSAALVRPLKAGCQIAHLRVISTAMTGNHIRLAALLFGGFALAEHFVPQLRAGVDEGRAQPA